MGRLAGGAAASLAALPERTPSAEAGPACVPVALLLCERAFVTPTTSKVTIDGIFSQIQLGHGMAIEAFAIYFRYLSMDGLPRRVLLTILGPNGYAAKIDRGLIAPREGSQVVEKIVVVRQWTFKEEGEHVLELSADGMPIGVFPFAVKRRSLLEL